MNENKIKEKIKLKLEKKAFQDAIQTVMSSVAKNPTVDMLSYIKIELKEGCPTPEFSSTNMENQTTVKMQPSEKLADQNRIQGVDNRYSFLIKAENAIKMLKTSKAEFIEIEITELDEEVSLDITLNRSNFKLRSPKANNYPTIKTGDYLASIEIDCKELLQSINHTEISISKNIERYNLTGLFFQIEAPNPDGVATMTNVSTDGHRLSKYKIKVTNKNNNSIENFLLPGKAVSELKKMLSSFDGKSKIQLNNADNVIEFKIGNISFISKKLDATFPDWQKVMPQNNHKILEIDKDSLLNSLSTVRVVNDLKGKGARFEIKQDSLEIKSKNNNEESVVDHLDCSFNQNEIFIATYNPEFIEDAFKVIKVEKGEKISISLDQPNQPILIESPDNGYTFVIMPMRNED